jgi:hypothetical protein
MALLGGLLEAYTMSSPSFPVARHGLPVSLPKTPKGENHGFFNNPTNVSDGL